MDFHSLTRRELQTLCKKNKIPANLTNVAMADALKHLSTVEGIEEFMQPYQTGQSSSESPPVRLRSEATSAYAAAPPTGGRSTRLRTAVTVKEEPEPETVKPMARIRNTLVKLDADASQTPALVAHSKSNRNRKKECDGLVMTPAPAPASQRRRVREESVVKRVYSTRRSTRLAEKNVNEVNNEASSELFKKEEDFDQVSGVTDTTFDEYESQVISVRKQDVSIGEEIKVGCTTQENQVKVSSDVANEEAEMDIQTKAEMCEKKCAGSYGESVIKPQNSNGEVQESGEGVDENRDHHFEADEPVVKEKSNDMETEEEGIEFETKADRMDGGEGEEEKKGDEESSDVETEDTTTAELDEERLDETEHLCGLNLNKEVEETDNFENMEELNIAKGGSEDKASDHGENVVPAETKVDEFSCNCEADSHNEIEKELHRDRIVASNDVPDVEVALVKFTELRLQEAAKEVLLGEGAQVHLAIPQQLNQNDEACKTKILEQEERIRNYDGLVVAEMANNPNPSKQHQLEGVRPTSRMDDNEQGLDNSSHASAHKPFTTMKRMTTVFSDDKENIGSGSKLVPAKIDVQDTATTDLNEMSIRKLSKMLREKLEITKKSSKNAQELSSRPALQALNGNRPVDETQN